MLCKQCGNELTDKDKFCPNCGIKVTTENVEVQEEKVESTKGKVTVETTEVQEEKVVADNIESKEENATSQESEVNDETKDGFDSIVDSAKKAGETFAASETVKEAKKEFNNIISEAKTANDRQAGKNENSGNGVEPRESVSFFVDWFYWTGRRGRLKYLLVGLVTSLCSLAFGSTGILSLLFCYMSAVNLVKRLHDCDKSGLFAFLLMGIEYLIINLSWIFGLIGLGVMASGSVSGLFVWIIPLLLVWGIKLWVFFVPGTSGANKYGPEPK